MHMKRQHIYSVCVLTAAILSGCSSIQSIVMTSGNRQVDPDPAHIEPGFVPTREGVIEDTELLGQYSQELRELASELEALKKHISGKSDNDLTDADHELAEGLLYRYLICRSALRETAARYSRPEVVITLSTETRIKASLLGFLGRQLIYSQDALFVDLFCDEPWVIAKLNAEYTEVNLPKDTYEKISNAVLSTTRREIREAAWRLFFEELRNPYSALSRQDEADPECHVLIRAIRAVNMTHQERTRSVLTKQVSRDPGFQTRTNPARVYTLIEQARTSTPSSLDAAIALDSRGVFTVLASPFLTALDISPEQRKRVHELINPGDIILTYCQGSIFSMFLREPFVHGIVYVGDGNKLTDGKGGSQFATRAKQTDTVEAVSIGVTQSALDHIMTKRKVARIAILRPRLEKEDIKEIFGHLATFVGRKYDLRFDFFDDRRLCCTEVIFHTFNGRGNIAFTPIKRLGLKTVSAGDILKVALAPDANAFDVICVLDSKSQKYREEKAMLLTGRAATDHLRRLMR
jgi:hypothetical protein